MRILFIHLVEGDGVFTGGKSVAGVLDNTPDHAPLQKRISIQRVTEESEGRRPQPLLAQVAGNQST